MRKLVVVMEHGHRVTTNLMEYLIQRESKWHIEWVLWQAGDAIIIGQDDKLLFLTSPETSSAYLDKFQSVVAQMPISRIGMYLDRAALDARDLAFRLLPAAQQWDNGDYGGIKPWVLSQE